MNNNFYTWSLSAFRNFSIGNQLANCSLTNISKFSQNSKHQGQERWLLPGLAEDSWLTHSAHWVPHNCRSSGSREFNIPGLRGHGHSWAHTCTHARTQAHTYKQGTGIRGLTHAQTNTCTHTHTCTQAHTHKALAFMCPSMHTRTCTCARAHTYNHKINLNNGKHQPLYSSSVENS